MRVLITEIFATFVFVSVILAVKSYADAEDGPVNCLAVGGTLYGMLKTAGGASGGCLNPAVGIAQSVF